MSDALTDLARDERRLAARDSFEEGLITYLTEPNETNWSEVIDRAKWTDGIPGGYWNSQTRLSEGIEELLEKLSSADRTAWAQLLKGLMERRSTNYKRMKVLSPFKDQLLVIVDYGMGFVNLKGDLDSLFLRIIDGQNLRTYDCDTYLVALPQPEENEAEVIWVECGIVGQNEPRPARR